MLTICLIAACVLLTLQTMVSLAVIRFGLKKFNGFISSLNVWLTPPEEGKPSPADQVIDQVAHIFAERIRISLTAAQRGAQGAAARDINRGLEDVAIENTPELAFMGRVPKSLKKNELARFGLGILLQKIQNQGGLGGSSSGARGNHSQTKFDF